MFLFLLAGLDFGGFSVFGVGDLLVCCLCLSCTVYFNLVWLILGLSGFCLFLVLRFVV